MVPSHKKATSGHKSKSHADGRAPERAEAHGDAPAEKTTAVGDLDEALSYVLKRAAASLRNALSAELRPLNLTVAQHSCLELLGRSPGLSSAELARGAFVTRQSMNLVLRGLQDRGLVTRPAVAAQGRALPTKLTATGRTSLNAANAIARRVEKSMLEAIPEKRRLKFRHDLAACAEALALFESRADAGAAVTAE